MDDAWKQLPCAAVIVCAGVLGSSNARAQQPEPAHEADASTPTLVEGRVAPAPTCGAACHGGGEVYEEVRPPPDIQVAPTCGPSCHGGGDEGNDSNVAPPPVEPAKKGCAVEDDEPSPLGLAVLSLGLLAGVGSRRRRE